MKQIFVVRHGETDNNKAHIIQGRSLDASLNELGHMQARAICDELCSYDIEKIVASSLKRTHETAFPLTERLNLPMEQYAELDEINFGELEGQVFTEIKDKIREINEQWKSGKVDYAPKNGESPVQTFKRANDKIQEILRNSEETNIAFIIHGRLIRILLSVWLGHGLENMHKIEHQNGAINHLVWNNDSFEAVELNKCGHLNELV